MAHNLALSIAKKLVAIDTVNPPGNEKDAVRVLAPLLQDAGFSLKEYDYGPNRSSLVAHMGRTDQPSVILSGHLDTVPFGSQPWSVPPLSGSVIDDRLYGRGSTDMKGGVAVLTAAAVHLASRLNSSPLTLVFSSDEEIGCGGIRKLIGDRVLPKAHCVLVAEPTGNVPCLGHKGVLWLKTIFHGTTAHAAFPHLGDNALLKASHAIVALNDNIVSGNPHPVMGDSTLVTSRCFSGDNYNSIPDLAEVGIDIRSTANWSHDAIISKIETLLSQLQPEINTVFDLPPLWTSPEAGVVKEIFNCCNLVCSKQHTPQIVTFYTDGGLLGPGLDDTPVIILGPGESGMAHQVDEYVQIADLNKGVDIYLEILSRLCC